MPTPLDLSPGGTGIRLARWAVRARECGARIKKNHARRLNDLTLSENNGLMALQIEFWPGLAAPFAQNGRF
ncbi:MAG: hypothetical protein D6763_09390 [Alphaproteobacteria bacterium]|nr:MAG: hypothetical protein D6763_09390 [Alphaproteobacteria bacterium]